MKNEMNHLQRELESARRRDTDDHVIQKAL